jgi:hypothetical protein
MARRPGAMFAVWKPLAQSVAAPITESQCGSGDLTGAVSVLDQDGWPLLSTSSLSCGLEAMGVGGVVAPDGSENMEQAPFE